MRWYLIGLAAALCARHATSNDSVLDVTRPRAGDAVIVGSEVEVAWAATGDTTNACSNASLALYRNGDLYSAITSSPEASPYNWTVGLLSTSHASGAIFRIMADCRRLTFHDFSGPFTIVPSDSSSCTGGNYFDVATEQCEPCAMGSYSDDGATSCAVCEPGRFNARVGAASCESCEAGTYSSANGSVACMQCAPRHRSPAGSVSCEWCDESFWWDGEICQACPVMPVGQQMSYGQPIAYCAGRDRLPAPLKGFWSAGPLTGNRELAGKVYECPYKTCAGSLARPDSALYDDDDAYLTDDEGGERLLYPKCWVASNLTDASDDGTAGTSAATGGVDDTASTDETCCVDYDGHGTPSQDSLDLCKDSSSQSSAGGSNCVCKVAQNEAICTEGATGLLCGSCTEGYTYDPSSQSCESCEDKKFSRFLVLGILIGVIVVGWCFTYLDVKFILQIKKSFFVQLMEPYYDTGTIKILFATYQIIASVGVNLEIDFPPPFDSVLGFLSKILAFDLAGVAPACLHWQMSNYHLRVYVSSAIPIILVIIIIVSFFIRRWIAERDETLVQDVDPLLAAKKKEKDGSDRKSNQGPGGSGRKAPLRARRGSVMDAPALATGKPGSGKFDRLRATRQSMSHFQALDAETVKKMQRDSYDKSEAAKIYSQHMQAFLLVTYLILPTMSMVQFRGLSCSEEIDLGTSEKYQYLRVQTTIDCNGDAHKSFIIINWCLILVYQAMPLVWLTLLLGVRDRLVTVNNDTKKASGEGALQKVKYSKNDVVLSPLKFLVFDYTPDCFVFDVIDMYRRIAYIAFLGALPFSKTMKATFGIMISIFFLMIHTTFKPYVKDTTNKLAEFADYQIFFAYFLALMIEAGLIGKHSKTEDALGVGIALAFVNLLVLGIVAWVSTRAVMRYKAKQRALANEIKMHRNVFENSAKGITVMLSGDKPNSFQADRVRKNSLGGQAAAAAAAVAGHLGRRMSGRAPKPAPLTDSFKTQDGSGRALQLMTVDGKQFQIVADHEEYCPITDMPVIRELLDCTAPGAEDSMPELEAKVLRKFSDLEIEAEVERAMAENFGVAQVTNPEQRKQFAMAPLVSVLDSQVTTDLDAAGRVKPKKSKGTKTLKDAKRTLDKLTKRAQKLKEALDDAITSRCRQRGVIVECDHVIVTATKASTSVYNATWSLIEHSESRAIEEYESEVAAMVNHRKSMPIQKAKTITKLYEHAARVKPKFDEEMKQIAKNTITKLDNPRTLKPVVRIIEKALLRRDEPGNFENVCDVVRCMFMGTGMSRLADVVSAFDLHKDIVVVGVKDRFCEVIDPSGWRDLIIRFYFKSDSNKHVCEAQVSHNQMLGISSEGNNAGRQLGRALTRSITSMAGNALTSSAKDVRGSFGAASGATSGSGSQKDFQVKKPITETKGRGLYLRVRNAHEILAKMNFADHKKRPQQIAKLRDGGVPLIHLGRIGCSVKDLLKAGIEASELKAAGINVRRSILFHRSDSTAEGNEFSGHLSGHLINEDLEDDGVPSDDSYRVPIKQTRKLSQASLADLRRLQKQMSADEPTEEQKALAVVLSLAQGNKQPAGSGEGGGGSDGESNSTSSDEEDEAESSPVVAREDRGVSEAEAKDDLAAAGRATDSKPNAASPMRPPRGLPPMSSLAESFDEGHAGDDAATEDRRDEAVSGRLKLKPLS